MPKPKVLVFIDWYLPGYKAGGPVRSVANLVDHLRDRIDFHIVTTDTDYTERTPYAGVTPDRWTVLQGGEKVWYASRACISTKVWRELLAQERWHTVYINGMYSRWFSIEPLRLLRGSKQRRVVAVRGMLASGMMRHGALKKRAFLAAMRLLGAYRGVEFQATNQEELQDVKEWISADAIVHLVPNLGRRSVAAAPPSRAKEPGTLRLISVARIAVEKNTLFAIQCLRDVQGGVTCDLFGPVYDQGYWAQCRQAIAELPANVRVNYKGVIPSEQVPALFANYHALFMPSQGENFGHTMAEALASGLPLLISDRTPWRGLEAARAGWDLALADGTAWRTKLNELIAMDQISLSVWCAGAFALGSDL
ncbi:MAG: glycosyltransferase [Flavobacteriales bacterium]|nr:glycosyltransferase [Flavobacteriales bacterium]